MDIFNTGLRARVQRAFEAELKTAEEQLEAEHARINQAAEEAKQNATDAAVDSFICKFL